MKRLMDCRSDSRCSIDRPMGRKYFRMSSKSVGTFSSILNGGVLGVSQRPGFCKAKKENLISAVRPLCLHVATYLKDVRDILGNVDDEEHLRPPPITQVVINVQQGQRRSQLLHIHHQRRHRRWSQGINRQIAAEPLNRQPDGARIELLT